MKLNSLEPFIYEEAKILILGTMTPELGRDLNYDDGRYDFFYTSYDQNIDKLKNQLYEILDKVFDDENSFQNYARNLRNINNTEEIRISARNNLEQLLRDHNIAIFDLIDSCETNGHASDSSLSDIILISKNEFEERIGQMPNLQLILVNSRCVESLLAKIMLNGRLGRRLPSSKISINRSNKLNEVLNGIMNNLTYRYVPSPSSNANRYYNIDDKITKWCEAIKSIN